MNYRTVSLVIAAGTSFLMGLSAGAQEGVPQSGDLHPVLRPDTREFDPHDLNGIWTRGNPDGGFAGAGSCVQGATHSGPCGDRGFSQEWPSFTPEGQKAFDANKPSYGRRPGSADAAEHPEEHIGRHRAVQQGNGNDPAGTCNPLGVSRALIYPQENEFVMVGDRILQHFSQTNAWRSIWMDGRSLPEIDDIAWPLWYGYSVGRWEGDTLVVETIGQDDRVWLDQYGYPLSDEARLEERYRRISYSVLELNMTLTDPKYYTKPWISQTKKFLWRPKDYFKNSNWPGMYYDDCAPADEVDVFKSMIVDPAAKQAVQPSEPAEPPVSIREVMELVIVPATDVLWGADDPQTDEEWQHLENAAITVITAGATINRGGSGPQDNEWARSPAWSAFTDEMTNAAVKSLEAIRNRDNDALFESGMVLYPPCESCHLQFNPGVISQ